MVTQFIEDSARKFADSLIKRRGLLTASWSYDYSVVWRGMEALYALTGDKKYYNYIYDAVDTFISPEGEIRDYSPESYNLDLLCIGKELVYLYKRTGEERFLKAIKLLRSQLDSQPRTQAGGFWHKKIYPNQMWLDGQHMCVPFYLMYELEFGHNEDAIDDAAMQLILAYEKTYDPKTGLNRHAWNEDRQQPWAESGTGLAPHAWGRAMGWYAVALADSLELLPRENRYYPRVLEIFNKVSKKLLSIRHDGVWYQVLDCPDRRGNYLESSASCLMTYAILKGARLGLLPEGYGKEAQFSFRQVQLNFLGQMQDGEFFIAKCCKVAGLGNTPYRDGSFDYYLSEDTIRNDLKAAGGFLQAAVEYELAQKRKAKMKLLYVSAVSAALLVDEKGDYFAGEAYTLYVNGAAVEGNTSVISLYGLVPDAEYEVRKGAETLIFRTKSEYCCLNVRDFGAKGDGESDDTPAIQAAIGACPEGGRVLIPEGKYNVLPLFLKSEMTLEIANGAQLLLSTDTGAFPILPGRADAANPHGEYIIGGWEGDAHACHASAINGFGLKNVNIIGEGTVNGRGGEASWWQNPKTGEKPARPRMLYLRDCENVTVQGVRFIDSPSWNLHPCFSRNLLFVSVSVSAPWDSPNTDGFDPESCKNVKALGVNFSTGDDCIAIKSGKMYMGREYKTPCEDIEIAYCRMMDGHGGVTVGSEMSGGVRRVRVHNCLMEGNDRGLRIKTRRGRGRWGVIDDIVFTDVKMRRVKAPMTVNAMYFCDADGKTPYVQSREKQPVDEGTPTIGSIVFERVEATDCQACCAYMLGLPENPAHELKLRDCVFTMDENAVPMSPIMSCDVEPCAKKGIYARFVDKVTLENVRMEGVEGEEITAQDVGEVASC